MVVLNEGGNRNNSALKHTLFISKLKIVILSVVILLVMAIVIMPLTNFGKPGFKLSFEKHSSDIGDDTPTMTKPKLHGINNENQPYNISADKAVQLSQKVIELYVIDADIYMQDGTWITVSADKGLYDAETREMDITGNINLFVDNAYEMATNSAKIYLLLGHIIGEEMVTVKAPMGMITSDTFSIDEKSSEVRFRSNVHLRTYIKEKKEKIGE